MSSLTVPAIHISRRKPLAACVAAVFALSTSGAVYATTFSVSNCADTGFGSLRSAAGEAVSGDTIDMTDITTLGACANGVDGFTDTILLNSKVTLAGGVTINGPPIPALAVSGQNKTQVFASSGNLTINNLGVIYGGSSTPNANNIIYGGCIYANADVSISGVVMDHCTAYSAAANTSAEGGAIGSRSGSITLTNSKISHSLAASVTSGAAFGGALSAYANVTLNNSFIEYATTTTVSGYAGGGAIFAQPLVGVVTLTNSQIAFAYVNAMGPGVAEGGGIVGFKVHLTDNSGVEFTHVIQYGTSGGSAEGGAVFGRYGVTISDSAIHTSEASSVSTASAAMALGGSVFSGAYVTLNHFATSNKARRSAAGSYSRGGGMYSSWDSPRQITPVCMADSATGDVTSQGAGIHAGSSTMNYSILSGNSATNTRGAGVGGGARVTSGNTYLRGTSVYGNYSPAVSSALHLTAGGATTVTFVNSTISGNSTPGQSAIYARALTTKFHHSPPSLTNTTQWQRIWAST